MTEESVTTKNVQPQTDWKTRAYTIGAVAGLGFGLVAAYLFARAADEEENPPEPIQTTRLMSVGLAALALIQHWNWHRLISNGCLGDNEMGVQGYGRYGECWRRLRLDLPRKQHLQVDCLSVGNCRILL